MQANFMIEQKLGQQLIDFFAQHWIDNEGSSPYHHYTAKEASQKIFAFVDFSLKHGFETSWTLGGTSHNCWGDSSSVSPDTESDLPFLDEFFIEFYPLISFMQYKIISKSISRSTKNHSDYYGGSTIEAHKNLSIFQLSQAMINVKLIVDPVIVSIDTLTTYIVDKYSSQNLEHIFKPIAPKKNKKQRHIEL